jgi:hypothetical protein
MRHQAEFAAMLAVYEAGKAQVAIAKYLAARGHLGNIYKRDQA